MTFSLLSCNSQDVLAKGDLSRFPPLDRCARFTTRQLSHDTLALNWTESETSFASDGDCRKRFTQKPVLVQPDAKESAVKIYFW